MSAANKDTSTNTFFYDQSFKDYPEYEPEETRAKKGDILIAKYNSGTGEGMYAEDDTYKGKEYVCLDIYECNGPCVFIDAESCSWLGMSQDSFRIKKRNK